MTKDGKASMNELEDIHVTDENIHITIEDNVAEGEPSPDAAESGYRRMCMLLYAYRFGTIGFLDLMARFEAVLGIMPPPDDLPVIPPPD
jgi:hypothetical protein